MTTYLLDTNHLSSLITLNHPIRDQVIEHLEKNDDTFAVPIPALTETLFGIGLLPRATKNLDEWDRLKSNFEFYIPDEVDAENAARLQISLNRQGWQLETIDAMIAAIALRYDLTLLTSDRGFSTIPHLKQANWLT